MDLALRNWKLTLTVIVIAALLVPLVSFAADFRVGEQTTLSAGETVREDVYMAGGGVTSAGVVTGDLVATGGSVLVTGLVTGDLMAAGGNITLVGDVGDDIRAAGGTITINGKIGGDVILAGGQLQVGGEEVRGDLAAVGGILRVDAPVSGNLRFEGGEVYLSASVGGNVTISADKIVLGPGVTIGGNLTYSAPTEFENLLPGQVKGEVVYKARVKAGGVVEGILATLSALIFLKFLMLFAGAIAVGLMFRRYSTTIAESTLTRPLASLGRGLVTMIVWPVVSIILLVTVVGIPLGVIGLAGFAVVMLFSGFIAAILVGSLVHRWIWKEEGYVVTWKTIFAGSAIYIALSLIPVLGWLAQLVLISIALGGIVKMKWDLAREWR